MKIVWSVIVAAAAVACASVFFAGAKHVAEDARPGGNAAPRAIQIRTMLPTAATQPPATPPSAATRDIAAKLDQTTPLAPHDAAELIRTWTRADPAAALLWILRTPERRALVGVAFATLAAIDRDDAFAFAEALPRDDPALLHQAYGALVQALLESAGPSVAIASLGLIPEESIRAQVAVRVVDAWARLDPASAARWVATLADSGETASMATNAAGIWAQSSARDAAEFARSLPPNAARRHMLGAIIGCWAGRDASAAGDWLARAAPEPDLDHATLAFATEPKLIAGDIDAALFWADRITRENLRWEALRVVIQLWALRDRSGAQHYVQTSPRFTTAERSWLLAVARNARPED